MKVSKRRPERAAERNRKGARTASPRPDETSTCRDPGVVALEVLLQRAIKSTSLTASDLEKRGIAVVVKTPGPEWTPAARKAWEALLSPEYYAFEIEPPSDWPESQRSTVFVVRSEKLGSRVSYRDDTEFADLCWRGVSMIGIAPELAFLPSDLVEAADVRLELEAPTPDALIEIMHRVTGSVPSEALTDVEATAVTPRLLRLAVRPGSSADDVLFRLRELIARELKSKEEATASEASETPTALKRSATPREEPHLDRLFGMDEAVEWGHNLKDDVAAYAAGKRAWSDVDRGVLLSGPPGTGKTMFARALANTCSVPLIAGSYAVWIGTGTGHQGDLIGAMRKTFADAKKKVPSILFIDEVDAFPDRSRVNHTYRQWDIQVGNALLAEIDGVEDRQGVVLIAACNNPDLLDPALVRSGRLDRHIRIGLPDPQALVLIMRQHLGSALEHEDLSGVATLALGFNGADVERAARGARRRARQAGREMTVADLVIEVAGPDDRTPEELWTVAVHEAGHVVAGHVLGLEVHSASLRASGNLGGGVLAPLRARSMSLATLNDRLVMLLSGRAAEEVVLGLVTSGAGGSGSSDLALATRVAAVAASELGFEDAYGLLWKSVPTRQEELGNLLASDPQLAEVVRERLATAQRAANALVTEYREAVVTVAKQLLERIALSSDQLAQVLRLTLRRREP
jgi:cell division protease FtsH